MTAARKRPHAPLALLATATLYWVLELSARDRGLVDWIVIAMVSSAIAWNILQVCRRLSHLGVRALWHVQRTVLFWIIGLLNTVYRSPDAAMDWRFFLGVALLGVAVADTIGLYLKERRLLASDIAGSDDC